MSDARRPDRRRVLTAIAVSLSLVLVAGCRESVQKFNPGTVMFGDRAASKSKSSAARAYDDEGTDAGDVPASRASSSSSAAAEPEIIDIPTRLSDDFTDKKEGYDQQKVYAVKTGDVRFLKVSGSIREHQHNQLSHVYYVVSGEAQMKLDENVTDVRAGQMIVVPPHTRHKIVNTGAQPAFFIEFTTPETKQADVQWTE